MKAAVVGTGCAGLVAGVRLADWGHEVLSLDLDEAEAGRLLKEAAPFDEPGLPALCARHLAAGRLSFGADPEALAEAEIVILAVDPAVDPETGAADLKPIWRAAEAALAHLAPRATLALRSAAPIGTSRALGAHLRGLRPDLRIETVFLPELPREGAASAEPLVVGAESARARAILAALHAPLTAQGLRLSTMGLEAAELIRSASGALLALRIACADEIADLCEALGVDAQAAAEGLGLGGPGPGPGYGGPSLPREAQALTLAAREAGAPLTLIEAAILANDRRKALMAERIRRACGGDLRGKRLAALGLAHRAGSADPGESAALAILPRLLKMGARLTAYDPAVAAAEAESLIPGLESAPSARAALEGADGAVLLTPWPEFAALGPREIARLLRTPLLIDLRNLFAPEEAAAAGLAYESIGRPPAGGAARLEALWREDAAEESRAEERLPAPLPPRPARAVGTAR